MDISLLFAPIQQLINSPACVLIVLPVSVVAWLWELNNFAPNKYIAPVCIMLGMGLYPALTPTTTVPPGFPNPVVVLVLNGFILGFIAFLAHKYIVRALINKFYPPNDTEPKPEKTPEPVKTDIDKEPPKP